MSAENIGELETLFGGEASGRRILLDLKNVTLVVQDIVSFLERSEANGIKLEHNSSTSTLIRRYRKFK